MTACLCFQTARLSACREEEIFVTFCIDPLSSVQGWGAGLGAASFWEEIVPSLLMCAEASAEDWCSSPLKWQMELWCRLIAAQCSSSCGSEELEGEKDFNAALRNQCAVWLALQSRQQKKTTKRKLKLQAAFRGLSLLCSAVARLCLPLMLLPHHKLHNKLSAAGLSELEDVMRHTSNCFSLHC